MVIVTANDLPQPVKLQRRMDAEKTLEVVEALRKSRKGRLKYDRNWHEEGRTAEIFDEIPSFSTITLSPQALSIIKNNSHVLTDETDRNETPAHVNNILGRKEEKKKEKIIEEAPKVSEDVHFFVQMSETELPIALYEHERRKSVQQLFNAKTDKFHKHTDSLQKQLEQQYHIIRQEQEIQALQKNIELKNIEQSCLKEHKENYEKMQEEPNLQVSVPAVAVDTRKEQQRIENELLAKKNKEQEELKSNCEKLCLSLSADIIPKIKEQIQFCEQKEFSDLPYTQWKSLVSNFTQALQMISGGLVSNVVSSNDLEKCQMLAKQVETLLQDISLASASKEAEREQENRSRLASLSSSPSKNVPATEKPIATNAVPPEASEMDVMDEDECANQNPSVSEEVAAQNEKNTAVSKTANIDVSAYQVYYNVMKTMKELDAALETFRSDPRQKKYRLMLHKAVAINTISDASGSQLRDKVRSLVLLLSGQTIECGGKHISAKEHQLAISYCKNLLAEKIVLQGEEQVGAKIAAAFPFACVAVTICSKFPDVEQLIMGHFYMKCPYLVPYYPPKEDGQSEEDYFVSLGYKYTDGKIEEKTNFLKRMHGCMGLYAAMMQCQCVPGYPSQNFFTLAQGWRWIAQVLNIDPRPDITATMLLVFLEVSGHAMMKSYDKQFKKVLHTLCKDYFAKMKNLESSGGGPIGRLNYFLQLVIKRGYISPPEGVINSHFWRT